LAVLGDVDADFGLGVAELLDLTDFGGDAVRDPGVGGVLDLLQGLPHVLAGHRGEALGVAVLQVVERGVRRRLGVTGAATAEQHDQQDDTTDDDERSDTTEDPRQRALLLRSRSARREATGGRVAGRRALRRTETGLLALRGTVTGLLALRGTVTGLLGEPSAGRLPLTRK